MPKIDFLDLAAALELVYTRRLALRPLAVADAWPLWASTRNPAFNSGLLWSAPETEAALFERVAGIMRAAQRGRLAAVSAVCRDTGQWVGLFRFQPHASIPGAVELGLWVHPDHWHGRMALELGKACVSAVFSVSEVQMLVGAAAPSNRGACELNRLGGMVPVRTVWRKHETLADVELLEHEITREQWQALAWSRNTYQMAPLAWAPGAGALDGDDLAPTSARPDQVERLEQLEQLEPIDQQLRKAA
jgi:RimJ/RimL family protein N-acetyltransferase